MLEKRMYKTAVKNADCRKQYISAINSGKPMFFISLETTGLDPMTDQVIGIRIIQSHINDRQFVLDGEKALLMKPDQPLDSNIEKISGITNEMLAKAKDPETIMAEIYDIIGQDPVLFGWNMEDFVIPFLKNAGFYSGYMVTPEFSIDLMEISQSLLPKGKNLTSYSLKNVASYLNVTGNDKVGTCFRLANELSAYIPLGSEHTGIKSANYWTKGHNTRFLFFETDHGKVSLNCVNGYWMESTPGFFDAVDMDGFTKYVCSKRNVSSIWDFIHLYEK